MKTLISRTLRGIVHPGSTETEGLKIGDIDPRMHSEFCHIISDKAKASSGGVLEANLSLSRIQ